MENIILNLQTFDSCNGVQAIPLIQVILMLTTDLNGNNERDQKVLNELLSALVDYVEMDSISNTFKVSALQSCRKFNFFFVHNISIKRESFQNLVFCTRLLVILANRPKM